MHQISSELIYIRSAFLYPVLAAGLSKETKTKVDLSWSDFQRQLESFTDKQVRAQSNSCSLCWCSDETCVILFIIRLYFHWQDIGM